MTALPIPSRWRLRKLTEMEVAEMIERKIEFYKEDADGNRRSVHLPMPFVRHYMKRDDGVLPTVATIATMPIVLADGYLLAPDGLNRPRGIWFEIQPEVRAIIPRPQDCTESAVREAMRFLCDDWLCDVATTYAGKATILAAALSVIERSILPDRPAFWITAGRRGSGKTTTIIMLLKGVTGLHPSSHAWATSEDERRKTLMAIFMRGDSFVLWDNIARGSQLSCAHIERACTSAFYSDRKLGVSEITTAASSAVHIFTGNNVGPKGDLASRSLIARLDIDELDPENRDFKHPDPIGWTENMRAEILAALYTILLGNPTLGQPRDFACKTRFKLWWRVVGAALEHAASLNGQTIDFKSLFIAAEDDEEESVGLAEALHGLCNAGLPTKFKAKDVAAIINSGSALGQSLREFLFGPQPPGFQPSAVSVGKRLKGQADNPVHSGNIVLTLKPPRTEREPQSSSCQSPEPGEAPCRGYRGCRGSQPLRVAAREDYNLRVYLCTRHGKG